MIDPNFPSPFPKSFYENPDTLFLARQLLGAYIKTDFQGELTIGRIVETEAYCGREDKACHAFGGKRSSRTEIMYHSGGYSYVFLCYGIHYLFNVVTNLENEPHAILIRAVEPLVGQKIMAKRRKKIINTPILASGPGAFSQAFGIGKDHNALTLWDGPITIHPSLTLESNQIVSAPRVGVGYAGEDAFLPYRFFFRGNPFVSKGK